jgi:tol-pal system protein YbgF
MKQASRKALPLLLAGLVAGPVGAATVTQIPVTEAQSSQPQSYAQSGQSQLLMLVQQLQEEVRQLRGMVETQQYRLDKMEREQRDRYRDIDRRLSALIQAAAGTAPLGTGTAMPPATPVDQGSAPAAAEASTAPAAQTSQAASAVTPAPATATDDSSAYQAAFALVRERRFDDARSAFDAFIARYPQSDNLANAHYWIGEIDLAQQSLASAKAAFQRVVDGFSGHSKVPDALYKLGVVEDRLGNADASRAVFQRLIEQFPQSSAAGLARNYAASR